jgi:hypothetical protein
MYSYNTDTTSKVCEKIGCRPSEKIIATLKRGGKIYIKASLLKPSELNWYWRLTQRVIEIDGCPLVFSDREKSRWF